MKPDEQALLEAIEANGGRLPDDFCERPNCMHHKRVIGILLKWERQGTWEYGVSVRTGWLIKKEIA